MLRESALERIEKETANLTIQEQLKLMEDLAHQIRKKGDLKEEKFNWDDLYGLGKDIWKNEDAQDYVDKLREDRA